MSSRIAIVYSSSKTMRGFLYTICLALLCPSARAYDAYVQLTPNDGNSDWVQIYGFSQDLENDSEVGSVSGSATADTVTLSMASNGSIAEMMKGIATGDFYQIRLHLVRRFGTDDYTSVMTEIVFDKVLFSGVEVGGGYNETFIVFDVFFQYGELRVTHTALGEQGEAISPSAAGWDFTESLPISVNASIPQLGNYTETVSPPPNPDLDNDLIPDSWEAQYNLNSDNSSDAGQDPDGDGFSNLEEYIAGTHPLESNSSFKATATVASGTSAPRLVLSWSAIAGRTYEVQASTQLTTGFTTIHTVIPSVNGVQTHEPALGAERFFRIRVSQ